MNLNVIHTTIFTAIFSVIFILCVDTFPVQKRQGLFACSGWAPGCAKILSLRRPVGARTRGTASKQKSGAPATEQKVPEKPKPRKAQKPFRIPPFFRPSTIFTSGSSWTPGKRSETLGNRLDLSPMSRFDILNLRSLKNNLEVEDLVNMVKAVKSSDTKNYQQK